MKKKIRIVCRYCGSEDIVADASAVWDFESQEWVLGSVYDKGHYCGSCEDETRIDFKEEI